jgi:predicted small secreted protein
MDKRMSDTRRMAWMLGALGAVWAAALTGCNTVEGVGEDVESAGEGISEAADETQDEIFEEDGENYR